MTRVFTSKKNILGIEEFIENYVGIAYQGPYTLSHNVMSEYVIEKKGLLLKRVNFKKVTKMTIATGTHLLVKDANGQILIYENPKLYSFNQLINDLNEQVDTDNLRKIRNKILEEQGYKEITTGEVVEMEAFIPEKDVVNCKANRQKVKRYK